MATMSRMVSRRMFLAGSGRAAAGLSIRRTPSSPTAGTPPVTRPGTCWSLGPRSASGRRWGPGAEIGVNTGIPTLTALTTVTLLLSACAGAAPAPAIAPPASMPISRATATLLPEEAPPYSATIDYTTDFSKHSVPYRDIISIGIPKDGIPAISNPRFIGVPEASRWLVDNEPVIFVEVGDDERAYPVQILTWHEVVNDTVGGVPVLITFCPLCNSAIAFERTLEGQVLEFGNTCRLYYSNLIMYDRQSQSWWQQASGEAIAGKLTGKRLVFRPASIISWSDFRAAYPDGKVLSRETGFERTYGRNPYVGYDDVSNPPEYYAGPET